MIDDGVLRGKKHAAEKRLKECGQQDGHSSWGRALPRVSPLCEETRRAELRAGGDFGRDPRRRQSCCELGNLLHPVRHSPLLHCDLHPYMFGFSPTLRRAAMSSNKPQLLQGVLGTPL